MTLNSHEIKTYCPYCKTKHDLSSNLTNPKGSGPKSGDITLCIKCGTWSVFHKNNGFYELRYPSFSEIIEIQSNETCIAVKQAWRLATVSREDDTTSTGI